jgi:hypothetical protein
VSHPKRYTPSGHRSSDFGMAESLQGRWVEYAEYSALKSENDDLKKEIGLMSARQSPQVFNLIEIERLQAENERLRKAGDAMVEIVHGTYCVTPPQALIDWLAAKETQP